MGRIACITSVWRRRALALFLLAGTLLALLSLVPLSQSGCTSRSSENLDGGGAPEGPGPNIVLDPGGPGGGGAGGGGGGRVIPSGGSGGGAGGGGITSESPLPASDQFLFSVQTSSREVTRTDTYLGYVTFSPTSENPITTEIVSLASFPYILGDDIVNGLADAEFRTEGIITVEPETARPVVMNFKGETSFLTATGEIPDPWHFRAHVTPFGGIMVHDSTAYQISDGVTTPLLPGETQAPDSLIPWNKGDLFLSTSADGVSTTVHYLEFMPLVADSLETKASLPSAEAAFMAILEDGLVEIRSLDGTRVHILDPESGRLALLEGLAVSPQGCLVYGTMKGSELDSLSARLLPDGAPVTLLTAEEIKGKISYFAQMNGGGQFIFHMVDMSKGGDGPLYVADDPCTSPEKKQFGTGIIKFISQDEARVYYSEGETLKMATLDDLKSFPIRSFPGVIDRLQFRSLLAVPPGAGLPRVAAADPLPVPAAVRKPPVEVEGPEPPGCTPAEEICGDGIDQDCDGGDLACPERPEPECTPAAEICDGVDNDCDGAVDNGFDVGAVCSAGVGACNRTGVKTCAAGGAGTTCDAVAGVPGVETCNSGDDDCNGLTDDGITDRVTGTDVGACQTEIQRCAAGAWSITQPGIGPVTETCNAGVDDDCDGTGDEFCLPPEFSINGAAWGSAEHAIAARVGDTITFDVKARDPDFEPGAETLLSISIAVSGRPSGSSFTTVPILSKNYRFTWTPTDNVASTSTITLIATDKKYAKLRTTQRAIITVAANTAPAFGATDPLEAYRVDEGTSTDFTVAATDADGDPITYSVAGLPAGSIFNDPAAPQHFIWVPDCTQGRTETYDVTFTATDGRPGGTANRAVEITVNNNVNCAPRFSSVTNPIGTSLSSGDTITLRIGNTLGLWVTLTDPDSHTMDLTARGTFTLSGYRFEFECTAAGGTWTGTQCQFTRTVTTADIASGEVAKITLGTFAKTGEGTVELTCEDNPAPLLPAPCLSQPFSIAVTIVP